MGIVFTVGGSFNVTFEKTVWSSANAILKLQRKLIKYPYV